METPPKQPQTFSEYFGIEVTTLCDANCSYCFALAQVESRHMTLDMAKQIALEAFDGGYRYMHLTGGEPLLWPHWAALVSFLDSTGFELILTNTGARAIKPHILETIAKTPHKIKFTVTLNGPPEIHKITRGDNFEAVAQNIQRLAALGVGVTIFTVVTKPLLPHLGKFLDFVYRTFPQIECLKLIQLHRPTGDEADLRDLIINESDFIEMVRIAGIYSMIGKPIDFLDNPLAQLVAKDLGYNSFNSPPLLRQGRLCVQTNGSITGAHSSRSSFGAYAPGMILELTENFSVWNSLSQIDKRCEKCQFREKCEPAMMTHPSDPNRDYNPEVPFCIRVNETLIQYQK